MKVVDDFGAVKENGRLVVVHADEVVDLHQDNNPLVNTFHVVRGKQRGATFKLSCKDRRLQKLDHIDNTL